MAKKPNKKKGKAARKAAKKKTRPLPKWPRELTFDQFMNASSVWRMKLGEDLLALIEKLTPIEVRPVVDMYYQVQHLRIQTSGQIRAIDQAADDGPKEHSLLDWLLMHLETLESQLKLALGRFVDRQPMGRWLRNIDGIGPVTSAGLLAHLDIEKAPTVGHFWSFAGIGDPNKKWYGRKEAEAIIKQEADGGSLEDLAIRLGRKFARSNLLQQAQTGPKGEPVKISETTIARALARRPHNSDLKTIVTFKIGESFVKLQGKEGALYPRLFAERKALEIQRNDDGYYVTHAKAKEYGRGTEAWPWVNGCYPKGTCAAIAPLDLPGRAKYLKEVRLKPGEGQPMLAPAHIHAIARRFAVKVFIEHFHRQWYRLVYKKDPPAIYPIEFEGHAHYINPPDWPKVA